MGIKNFSKIFEGKEVKIKELKNKTIAIDASILMYQSSLGMTNINALTDSSGKPTIHINIILSKCLNFYKNNIKQFWVFDYYEQGYVNPEKILEIERREKIKRNAKCEIEKLKKQKNDKNKYKELFSSDDEKDDIELNKKIYSQEKIGFSIGGDIINDIKFILDSFDIPWCDAPKGYEAESICAMLTESNCDMVWTNDTDAIIYGAKQMIRELKVKHRKKLILYDINTILTQNNLNINDLQNIAVISGCDHCKKTPKIGPKTILKKYKNIELTDEQKKAKSIFNNKYDITKLKWSTLITDSFKNKDKINLLINWLESRNFNRNRITKQIETVL